MRYIETQMYANDHGRSSEAVQWGQSRYRLKWLGFDFVIVQNVFEHVGKLDVWRHVAIEPVAEFIQV